MRKETALLGFGALALLLSTSCVTPAEFRKLERRVVDMQRGGGPTGNVDSSRVAEIGTQVDSLQRTLDELRGRLEVAEHRLAQALEEARAARSEAAAGAGVPDAGAAAQPTGAGEVPLSEEVQRYRAAYAAWRANDAATCIDQFTSFLQTYRSSPYADDATYWLGDCYFKQGNFSNAVLRFDDVARLYPTGNKAADALYRQGEALLRMGHAQAAGNAFEKVVRNYPDSARVPEAKRQLELLKAG